MQPNVQKNIFFIKNIWSIQIKGVILQSNFVLRGIIPSNVKLNKK